MWLPVTVIALDADAALPVPLQEVDGPRMALTVEAYLDSTVSAWRVALQGWQGTGQVQQPLPGQVLVVLIPLEGEGQGTGVETLPPTPGQGVKQAQAQDGWCGRLFSIEW